VTSLQITALSGIPLVEPGDDLVALIIAACQKADISLDSEDVLVISSKIVSKSEGRYVDLATVKPGERAEQVAQETRKDPRIVELILSESSRISRQARGVLVTEHRLGFVSASSGIDQSNVGYENTVLLLPVDPDGSARKIRIALHEQTGAEVGIVISDTHGRPFRLGNVGVAIGVAGMPALLDLRGQPDLFGRELEISQQGYADLAASAAHLVCGEGDEGLPVVLIRGLRLAHTDGAASDLNRPPELDLYR
jgi:coenzyme F420-0:L-glutamate ligase/coenzyme F420-1:gamma-L-glutamate ligase